MFNSIVNRNGKLALKGHAFERRDEPIIDSYYWQSDIPAQEWDHIIGQTVWFPNGFGYGSVLTRHGVRIDVDCRGWRDEKDSVPITKPHNGREYGWIWQCGEWRKDYFPRCENCYKYHDPAYTYCDDCGICHPPSHKHSKRAA